MKKWIYKVNDFFIKTSEQIINPIVNSYDVDVIDNDTIIYIKNKEEHWITIQFYPDNNNYRVRFECYQNDFSIECLKKMFINHKGLSVDISPNREVIVMTLNESFFYFNNFDDIEIQELLQLTFLSNMKKQSELNFEVLKSVKCFNENNVNFYKKLSNSIYDYWWSKPSNGGIEKVFCCSVFEENYFTLNNKNALSFFEFKILDSRKRHFEKELIIQYKEQEFKAHLKWVKGQYPKLVLSSELLTTINIDFYDVKDILCTGRAGLHNIPILRFNEIYENTYQIDILENESQFPIYSCLSSTEFTIDEINKFKELDVFGVTKRRREQSFLREYLFQNKNTEYCSICGKKLPVKFLVAAHIKPRAKCNNTERRDYRNIVLPMCKFGCDELYEQGYISVQAGKIIAISKEESTEVINNYIKEITKKKCLKWSKEKQKYFNWHYRYHINRS